MTHIQTPLIDSTPLGEVAGRQVLLKMEAMQPTGSFKARGVGRLCEAFKAEGVGRLVSSSGGNAGIAAAWSGRRLGLPVTVVVPETTPAWMRRRIERECAEVIVHGAAWDEAHALALEIAARVDGETGRAAGMVHPFDHPAIWSGHATMIEEVARALAEGAAGGAQAPGSVVLSVGGGGLLMGVLQGLEAAGWSSVPTIAVETEGAASLNRALEAGAPVDIGAIRTVAGSLGARRIEGPILEMALRRPVVPCEVTDAAAIGACRRFLDDHRVLVEPACGAALSVVYNNPSDVLAHTLDGPVLVIVCGGAVVTLEELQRWESLAG